MISHVSGRIAVRSTSFRRLQKSSLAAIMSSEVQDVPQPTSQQLRILALRSAIPMVGFGIMDNIGTFHGKQLSIYVFVFISLFILCLYQVMITAGEAIDASIGVAFGLSTLAAAGLGQCCSDVAGITSGGVVDAAVNRFRLPHHNLTESQLDLKAARIYRVVGSCVGVVTGCLMGMSVLFFMDTNAVERAKKAKELESIFESIVVNGHNLVQAERATLWMVDGDELFSSVTVGTKEHVRVPKDSGVVGAAIKTGENMIHVDASSDERFDSSVDKKFGYTTKTLLTVPVKKESGQVIGAIQMHNKLNDDGTDGVFTMHDLRMVGLLASHVATYIRVVNGGD
jgi:putative methionine-R-sulfoxide reductase with GAF domain